jgi:hypothetical protein
MTDDEKPPEASHAHPHPPAGGDPHGPCPRGTPPVRLQCRPPDQPPPHANLDKACPSGAELGPQQPKARAERARELRVGAADFERNRVELNPPRRHPRNTDESLTRPALVTDSPGFHGRYFATFSKGLPHNDLGEVREDAYCALLRALRSGQPGTPPPAIPVVPAVPVPGRDDFENVPLGCPPQSRKLEDPQAAFGFALAGADSHALFIPPPPEFGSEEEAAEMAELYWMALARDVPFTAYTNVAAYPVVAAAAADLNTYKYFNTAPSYRAVFGFPPEPSYKAAGPGSPLPLTPSNLFRGLTQGDQIGPYVSQLLLRDIPYGAQVIPGRIRTLLPRIDYLTSYDDWLLVQNGCDASQANCDPVPRFIRNGRDLGQYVHVDQDINAFYNAAFLLFSARGPLRRCEAAAGLGIEWARCLPYNNPFAPFAEQFPDRTVPGNPPAKSSNQIGIGTFGPQHLVPLLTYVVHVAFEAVWYQKWAVHRRLRPEEYGGRVHNQALRGVAYGVPASLLGSALFTGPFDPRLNVLAYNALQNHNRRRAVSDVQLCDLLPPSLPPCAGNRDDAASWLLPLEYAEGSPLHPAYGSGHATAAGACATILKAFFPGDSRITNPLVATEDGANLVLYTGADADRITVGGEIDKLASNIALGRNFAGVHWRSDYTEALRLGECVAVSVLEDHACLYNEDFTFSFRSFDGQSVQIGRRQDPLHPEFNCPGRP